MIDDPNLYIYESQDIPYQPFPSSFTLIITTMALLF